MVKVDGAHPLDDSVLCCALLADQTGPDKTPTEEDSSFKPSNTAKRMLSKMKLLILYPSRCFDNQQSIQQNATR